LFKIKIFDGDTSMPDPLIALVLGFIFMSLLTLLFYPNRGFIGYIRRMRQLSARVLQEDALKHLQKAERHSLHPTLESLAGALQISTSKAASLLKDMQEQDLVSMQGETFQLTTEGRNYALQIIRAHRLWERYLSDETGFDEAQWHNIAERYEHEISLSEADDLAAQLGNPTYDPHGDPIPTSEGEMVSHGGQPLTSMSVEDEPEAVYAQLVAEGLHTGMAVRLIEKSPHRVRFWANGGEHLLAPIVAASITVSPILQEISEKIPIGEPLNTLQPGEKGKVVTLSPRFRGQDRRRMMDLGILPGTIIEAELESPGGDPTAYRIRGALIALRRENAIKRPWSTKSEKHQHSFETKR
jgi:DtxR family Mn-dependent transcriptional regulator